MTTSHSFSTSLPAFVAVFNFIFYLSVCVCMWTYMLLGVCGSQKTIFRSSFHLLFWILGNILRLSGLCRENPLNHLTGSSVKCFALKIVDTHCGSGLRYLLAKMSLCFWEAFRLKKLILLTQSSICKYYNVWCVSVLLYSWLLVLKA